jgi:hypothetical protein
MSVTNTIKAQFNVGNKRLVLGKSVIAGTVATAEVVTGLATVDFFIPVVSAAAQQGVAVNETFPLASGTVTVLVETNDSTFYWAAVGN